jgi:hypothetical protein
MTLQSEPLAMGQAFAVLATKDGAAIVWAILKEK